MSKLPISVCMIVKNEAMHISRALNSVAPYCKEIVVCDTGSTDASLEIIANYPVKLFQINWHDDFAQARNIALEKCGQPWIFILDADEEIPKFSWTAIQKAIEAQDYEAFSLVRQDLDDEGKIIDAYPLTRLFRNKESYRYQGQIHEQITPSILTHGGKISPLDAKFYHYGYRQNEAQGGTSRVRRNLNIIERVLSENPNDPYFLYQKGVTLKAMGELEKAYKLLEKSHQKLQKGNIKDVWCGRLYWRLAQLDLAKNRLESVQQWLDSAFSCPEMPARIDEMQAILFLEAGKVEKAKPYIQRWMQSGMSVDEEWKLIWERLNSG